MSELNPVLSAHLHTGVTTVCHIWTLRLGDGQVFGFTDHDRDIYYKSVRYKAGTGLTQGSTDQRLGFSTDSGAVQGILSADGISSDSIEAGALSGARLSCAVMNWADPRQVHRVTTGVIGEVTRNGDLFTLEWLGEGAHLDRAQGRVFSRQCDAKFGDARCGLDANAFPKGTTCPRSFTACRSQFNNSANFRGFPYLIGDDAMTAAPQAGAVFDGGSRYKQTAR